MKRLKITLIILVGLAILYFGSKWLRDITVVSEVTKIESEHFRLTYMGIYEKEAIDVLGALESNYSRIRTELRDPEHGIIDVYIHPTLEDFNNATHLHGTATGTSRGPLEFHIRWTNWHNSFFPHNPTQTAIHEFTHCIQLNILITEALEKFDQTSNLTFDETFEQQFLDDYPQWFWEAVCVYEAGEVNRLSVKYGLRQNLSLQDLSNSNQIYNLGYTIIEYLVSRWGSETIPELISSYCDFESVLGITEQEFEDGWYEYTFANY